MNNKVVAFVPDVKEFDSRHQALTEVRKYVQCYCDQNIEEREEMGSHFDMSFWDDNQERVKKVNNYYDLLFCSFSLSGKIIDSYLVKFDFENSNVTISNVEGKTKTINIAEDRQGYVYRVLKTKLSVKDGIQGLYKEIIEHMHVYSVFNSAGLVTAFRKYLGVLE